MRNLTLERMRRNKRVCEIFARVCDFDVTRNAGPVGWFRLESPESFQPIAEDGSGGVYLLGSGGRILYVTSDGMAGVIATSLADALSLFVALPDWLDLLKFSGRGDLAEMRRAASFLERQSNENATETEKERDFLRAELSLGKASDPIAKLHEAVSLRGADIRIHAPDGTAFDSLFNRFTVNDIRA